MKRFTAILLTLVMLASLSVCAFADDFTAWHEMQDDPENGNPADGVSAVTEMKLYMDRNGKIVTDMDGNKVSGKIKENVFAEFYRLMNGVPVDWSKFDRAEFEVFMDINNKITFGKQIMYDFDGTAVESSDANVVIYETPAKFHATGSGSCEISLYDAESNRIGSSEIRSRMISTGEYVYSNICSKCGEDQGKGFHLMVCGHYSCEVGEVGHGQGSCGVPGHLNCDGEDHSSCPNCLKPLCSGKHGEGVCKHAHNWVFAGGGLAVDKSCWVNRFYCAGCQTYVFGTEEIPECVKAAGNLS